MKRLTYPSTAEIVIYLSALFEKWVFTVQSQVVPSIYFLALWNQMPEHSVSEPKNMTFCSCPVTALVVQDTFEFPIVFPLNALNGLCHGSSN